MKNRIRERRRNRLTKAVANTLTADEAERATVSDDVSQISTDNRGLTLNVYFYGDVAGKYPMPVVPKVFWEQGRVSLVRNDLHGIEPTESLPFNHATDLLWKINRLLRENGIEVLKPRTVQTMRQLKLAGIEIAK